MSPKAPPGLTLAEFALLMAPLGPFETAPVLAVAVSGGRDSLSLALLTQQWALSQGGRIVALIVDHGLRAEAAAEAVETRARLAQFGINSDILCWAGPKPNSGLQDAARAARYRLLFDACRRHGILHLLVAHHAGDQAETVAMRAGRASGPDGLAGMAGLVEHRDARLLRPLLCIPRARLTATLVARRVTWIEDPSNADPRFERVRLRAAGVPPTFAADSLAGERSARESHLAECAVEALELDQGDTIAFDPSVFVGLGKDEGARLLGRMVQALARRDYPPRWKRLERAAARVSRVSGRGEAGRGKSGKGQDFTLSECHLVLRQGHDRRLRWIVKAESGRRDVGNAGQPLIPAVFFACGAHGAPHLD